MDLIRRLRDLETEGATGRLDVLGTVGGRIYLDRGAVGCAEEHGGPTMLLAMAGAGLFAPPEWAAALKAPPPTRWRTLVANDDARFRDLVAFARGFVADQLESILGRPARSAAFVAGANHSLGTLAAWRIDDLAPSAATRPSIDRSEFLELLAEISPHVIRTPPMGPGVASGAPHHEPPTPSS